MLAFVNGNVIDGTGAAALPGMTLLVEGKKIAALGKNLPVPSGATVIDLKGKTILPGLMEAHAHLGGRDDPPGLDSAKDAYYYAPMRDASLAAGVTTIRSCGDWMKDTVETREMIAAGRLRGPRLICSGKQFQRWDCHPNSTVWGSEPNTCANAGAYPDSPEEARALVRELKEAGVDYVKIVVTDTMVFAYPKKFQPLDDDVLEALVDESHKLGLWVNCHVDSPMQAMQMVRYGADEIDHLISMGTVDIPDESVYDELYAEMVARGTWFVPTITIVRTWNYMIVEKGAPATIDEYFIPHFQKAYQAGVQMGAGCDSGAPEVLWGPSLHAELKEYVYNVGMSPLEAIRCATLNNAFIFGIADKVGALKEGMLADLLVVQGDPSRRIDDIDNVAMVLKEGAIVVDDILA